MEVDTGSFEHLGNQVETLQIAVEHRTTIGVALGMLMERLHLEEDEAFNYLRRCSQAQNKKLYDLAVQVVATRELPDAPDSGGASAPLADQNPGRGMTLR